MDRFPGFPGLADTRLDRRRFLAALAAGVPLSAALLAACGRSPSASENPEIQPARVNQPVTLPLFDDLPPIADDLPNEDGVLRVFGYYPTYVAPKVSQRFEQAEGVKVEHIPFRSIDQAVARLRTGTFEADIFFPTLKVLGTLAAARFLQPLNPTYLPNLQANVWPQLRDPFYDVGSQYTVPYLVWTTGISWRNDMVRENVAAMDNPYDILWDRSYRGKVHLLNSTQDMIGMALLHRGVQDVNTGDPEHVAQAKEDLLDLVDAVKPHIDSTDYRDLFSGDAYLHQSWSGNLSFAQHYAPNPSDIEKLSYWWPKSGLIGSDTAVVLADAKNPVLAHRFLNFLMDEENAYENSVWLGYQAPIQSVVADRLVDEGAVPENLSSIIVTPDDFMTGREELELSPSADSMYHAAYDSVVAAAKRERERD